MGIGGDASWRIVCSFVGHRMSEPNTLIHSGRCSWRSIPNDLGRRLFGILLLGPNHTPHLGACHADRRSSTLGTMMEHMAKSPIALRNAIITLSQSTPRNGIEPPAHHSPLASQPRLSSMIHWYTSTSASSRRRGTIGLIPHKQLHKNPRRPQHSLGCRREISSEASSASRIILAHGVRS